METGARMSISYRIKCWLGLHNKVQPRYLKDHYSDIVDVLPHTIFEILSQFIERECSPEIVDWEASGHTVEVHGKMVNVRQEMQELYDWWHKYYNKERLENEDKLWDKISKYVPKIEFIPIEGITASKMERKWKNSWQKKQYQKFSKISIDQEVADNKTLIENCHRVVNLIPYLWT